MRRNGAATESAAENDVSSDEEEEEVELILPSSAPARAVLTLNETLSSANDGFVFEGEDVEAPPFDVPDGDDLLGLNEVFEDDVALDDDDAPFDAPDDIEECVGAMHVAPARELPLIELTELAAPPPVKARTGEKAARATPGVTAAPAAPPICIHASWDRTESGLMLAAFADDKRLARAEIGIGRGGLDGAAAELETGTKPDLVIVDTDLSGAEMLAGVSALMQRLALGAKVIVIGAVNDIAIMRALQQRGVAAYMMTPVSADDLARAVCELFAQTDRSRVIAVMGARGGVGASTLAQNLAWTIADKLQAPTALVDLDVGFGGAAVTFKLDAQAFVTDLMGEVDEDAIDRVLTPAHDHLLVAAAPGAPDLSVGLEAESVEAMLARVRRTSAYVVLDLPHVWTAWMKQALVGADDIVLVAGPDLASLRNTDNLIKLLREARGDKPPPVLTLSMTGVPKRPEIAAKEFAEAVNVEPSAAFAFDPELYGEAENNRRLLVEAAPKSKAALAIEDLACALTGRAVATAPKLKPRRDAPLAPDTREEAPAIEQTVPEAAPPLTLEACDEVPAAQLTTEAVAPPAPAPAITPANENTPADLSDFERAYIEKARRKAMAELEARRTKRRRRRDSDSRMLVRFLGVTAAASALMLVTTWSIRERAHAPAAAAPVQAVTLPAPPLDPAAALERDYAEAMALIAEEDPRGLPLLRRTAESGSALAQYRLAKLYESGDGVDMDPIVARQWTERAAAGGNIHAMHDLGFYHARGDAAPLDEAAAFRWFRQASEFGFADSQYNLGILYEQGLGVTADAGEALFWFTLAANQGDVAAVERLTRLQGDLTAAEIEQARARANAFRPRAPLATANE